MSYPLSIISVFIDPEKNFKGNTAAIVELDESLPDNRMQSIASDLNQPATTFIWKTTEGYKVRWFAPDAEIGLCGHGSLATFAYLDKEEDVKLLYNGGIINGRKNQDGTYSMMLDPIFSKNAGKPDDAVVKGLNTKIVEYYSNSNKNIVLLKNENDVKYLQPDFSILKNMDPFGVIITAKGEDVDFVSRTLVPKVQQLEDHATGSSHAALTPFWSERLNKSTMTAYQLSQRGGKFLCKMEKDQVILSGNVKVISKGEIYD